jgi:D-beta-D-heptose 7-phosphate kinase/D-beta-D-heptose 1-phosphate adenosyltransferase
MLDHYLWGDATRISPEAPVPVVNVSGASDTVGGAANVANNVASLGAAAEVVGGIGRDLNGDTLRARLRQNGIRFDEGFLLDEARTITKTRVVVRNQQMCRLDHEDPAFVYRATLAGAARFRLLEQRIAWADGVILSDYAKGVLSTAIIRRIAAAARKARKFLAGDPKPASANRYAGLDLLTPNRREAVEMSGLAFPSEEEVDFGRVCARIWARLRPENLVVTLGPDGMLISRRGRVLRRIPTAARQVYDVSGAGDTVIAALTLALTSGAGLEEAAHFANAAAGVVVGKFGTATVTPRELRNYLAHG